MFEIICSVHVTGLPDHLYPQPLNTMLKSFRTPDASNLSPQSRIVLNHLQAVGSITAVEASAVHRVRSVSRRITEIGDEGFNIRKEFKRDVNGQRYVRYVLVAA